jgi:beta-glucosidase-like glycosyl hydrolase
MSAPPRLGERTLREDLLPALRSARSRAAGDVGDGQSYNEIDGIPSHANRWLLTDVLRGEWGFKGAVVSDYFAIRELVTRHKMLQGQSRTPPPRARCTASMSRRPMARAIPCSSWSAKAG